MTRRVFREIDRSATEFFHDNEVFAGKPSLLFFNQGVLPVGRGNCFSVVGYTSVVIVAQFHVGQLARLATGFATGGDREN